MTDLALADFQHDIEAIGRLESVPVILDVVRRTTGMGFVAIARVTDSRWIACKVFDAIQFGLQPGGELDVESTICHEIRQSRQMVVIDDVDSDGHYCVHHTPRRYGFKSYISVPIVHRDSRFFGTLCAIDPRPVRLNTPETVGMFTLFAQLIAEQLDAQDQLATTQNELRRERALAELREQFIAVLGHDLRNPLAALDAGIRMLLRQDRAIDQRTILSHMRGSAVRMQATVDNVLDLTRSQLGGGLVPQPARERPVAATLEQVVAEYRMDHPDCSIHAELAVSHPVAVDHDMLARLFSNLLGNALVHGAAGAPVEVRAATDDSYFEVSVANTGDPIPAVDRDRLFQPYVRGSGTSGPQGLGLGLYIAAEIARAHRGSLAVTSDETATRFTFRMPRAPSPGQAPDAGQ